MKKALLIHKPVRQSTLESLVTVKENVLVRDLMLGEIFLTRNSRNEQHLMILMDVVFKPATECFACYWLSGVGRFDVTNLYIISPGRVVTKVRF